MKISNKRMSLSDEEKKRIFNGIWYTIHMYAGKANTLESMKSYREYITMLSENSLPCSDCSKHMREYLQSNPLESESNYFLWSWKFHNSVNDRLGKPPVPFETARDFYIGENAICTKCGSEPSMPEPNDEGNRGMTVIIRSI